MPWAILALTAACSEAPRAGDEPLLVLAASDLQYALPEVARLYREETGDSVVLVFGSTGNLAAQIEQGAPADVFFAANERFVDELAAKGRLAPDTRRMYAVGRIVLVASRETRQPASMTDLARPGLRHVAIANPEHAPYGMAAREAMRAAGVWEQVRLRLVLGENVSQTFQFVRTGNADAGVVALSVALGVPGTRYVLIPDSLHAPLRQVAAATRASRAPERARAFLRFTATTRARAVMGRFGFATPDAP
jgi:molybdate transport system substrate-binding protein